MKNVPNWAAEAPMVSSEVVERKMTPEEEDECQRLIEKENNKEG